LSLVDRMLGGPGKMPRNRRELSEIEVALVDQVPLCSSTNVRALAGNGSPVK